MNKDNEVYVYELGENLKKETSILVLKEKNGNRFLPVMIGSYEARSIKLGLDKIIIPRPLIHTLFVNLMITVKCSLQKIIVYEFKEGVYNTQLLFFNEKLEKFAIESRISDAVAIALQCNAPIYIKEDVFIAANITTPQMIVQAENEHKENKSDNSEFAEYDESNLKSMLQCAVDDEDYETAAKIRDEINKRFS